MTHRALRRHNILAEPGRRSSHRLPTPQGGGIAVIGVTAVVWIAIGAIGIGDWPSLSVVLASTLALAVVSWFDDVGQLPIIPRFITQIAAVTTVMLLAPMEPLTGGLLPLPVDRVLGGLLWLWFINLSGVQTLCICTGIIGVSGVAGSGEHLIMPAVIVGSAMAGFLPWNWHPARLFLGDVGSVPVGFVLGWLLLGLASNGQWGAALVLPSYYIADATSTLIGRAARGELIWQAHRAHFYQRAVAGRLSHAQASKAVALTGIWLLGCALLGAVSSPLMIFSFLAATMGVAGLLWYFQRAAHPLPPTA